MAVGGALLQNTLAGNRSIHAGHIKLNGHTVKPAREVRPGDTLELAVGDAPWTVRISGLNDQRRPASEARLLYQETPESSARRAAVEEARRLAPTPGSDLRGRPTKKARRKSSGGQIFDSKLGGSVSHGRRVG